MLGLTIVAAILLIGACGAGPARAVDTPRHSADRIGTLLLQENGTLEIDLAPVAREHAHRLIGAEHPDHDYLLAQAGRPGPCRKAALRRLVANVTMEKDGSLAVSPISSSLGSWRGLHGRTVVASGDPLHRRILAEVGEMKPGDTRPLVAGGSRSEH